MKTKQFLETYNGAPYSLEEIANIASEIDDNEDLQNAALSFLEATHKLEEELEYIEFEFG